MKNPQAAAPRQSKTTRPRGRKPSTPTLRDRLAAFFTAPCEIHATALATLLDVEIGEVDGIADAPGSDLRDERGMISAEDACFIAGMLTPPSMLSEVGPEHRRTTAVTVYANAKQVAAFRELHNKFQEHAPRSWQARLSFEDFLSDELDSSNLGGDGNTVIGFIHDRIAELERAAAPKHCDPGQGTAADRLFSYFFTRCGPPEPGALRGIRWNLERDHDSILFMLHTSDDELFMRELVRAISQRDAKEICHLVTLHPAKPENQDQFMADLCAAVNEGFRATLATTWERYGFFEFNPATKKYDLQIDPSTGEPLNA